jgi:circadian clock protein KaiC
LFASTIEVPINGLSAATQNIVVLRHVEHRASMLRVLAILKVRDDDYDARMREFRITEDGIRLLDTFAGQSSVAAGGGLSSDLHPTESRADQRAK